FDVLPGAGDQDAGVVAHGQAGYAIEHDGLAVRALSAGAGHLDVPPGVEQQGVAGSHVTAAHVDVLVGPQRGGAAAGDAPAAADAVGVDEDQLAPGDAAAVQELATQVEVDFA